jgi:hypothetical protein
MWIRLRQVAFVANQLQPVLDDLNAVFGLEVAFNDPGVKTFGLENALLPVGTQFIEVVAPIQEGTAGGRHLARRGGDGGYMVICHTDEHEPLRERVDALGIRKVLEFDDKKDQYRCLQMHPSDTGGAFLEIDYQEGGDDPMGPWAPAGKNWQPFVRTDVVSGISAVEVQCNDPAAVARRWSEITAIDLDEDLDGHTVLPLDNATVRFVPVTDGRGEGLGGMDLIAVDAPRAREAARARGLEAEDGVLMVGGMRCRLY